ncbi:MAG: hypothetical protein HOP08_01675 [Cyclobacteriaceae bacterium]|nr:hypothetical protein [Cyclobacteriaceae bacterium]
MVHHISKAATAVLLCLSTHSLLAQNPLSQTTQAEVGFGFTIPSLMSGQELLRSENLRTQGLSYFRNPNGDRKSVGKYPALSGISFHVGFYKPLRRIKGLMLGAMVRNSQTGSQPAQGGYEEGYFFNFITAGPAVKYYPFEKNNLFFKGDAGLASVLTKNRFTNTEGEQSFFHQFGIGFGASIGAGYSLTPFKNKTKAVDLQIIYQQLNTRVEVNGLGDDQWKFGAMNFSVSMVL